MENFRLRPSGQVIDRRVRELSVESVLLPLDTAAYTLKEAVSTAVIFYCVDPQRDSPMLYWNEGNFLDISWLNITFQLEYILQISGISRHHHIRRT